MNAMESVLVKMGMMVTVIMKMEPSTRWVYAKGSIKYENKKCKSGK